MKVSSECLQCYSITLHADSIADMLVWHLRDARCCHIFVLAADHSLYLNGVIRVYSKASEIMGFMSEGPEGLDIRGLEYVFAAVWTPSTQVRSRS